MCIHYTYKCIYREVSAVAHARHIHMHESCHTRIRVGSTGSFVLERAASHFQGVVQCIAACCSVLQCVAVCRSAL